MFKDYVDYIYVSESGYLDKCTTGIGTIYTVHYKNLELPYTASAQGKNLHQLIRKIYSELSERIGFGCYSFLKKQISTLNLEKATAVKCLTSDLGIGHTRRIGNIDTTGTAAETISTKVIEKAIFELLEKNELYLFWYLNIGERLKNSKVIERFLKRQGMDEFENYFFETQSLSLYPTVIYIAIKDNHIVATGISCTQYKYESIKNAIAEAKIIYMFNLRKGSLYLDLSKEEHHEACKFVQTNKFVSRRLKAKMLSTSNMLNLKLTCEVKDINICLNTFLKTIKEKIVSALSTNLLKCLPLKENILLSNSNLFLKKHPCSSLQSHVDCIVI